MEQVIFGVAGLLYTVVFFALLAAPAYVAYRLARLIRITWLAWVLPILVFVTPPLWVAASCKVFQRDCLTVAEAEYFKTPSSKPEGFLLDNRGRRGSQGFNGKIALETEDFQFFEYWMNEVYLRRETLSPNRRGNRRGPLSTSEVRFERIDATAIKSKYVIKELAAEPVRYWWKPPIYIVEIHAAEIGSSEILARATDLVFGGGLSGIFMTMIGGDQDYEHVSCGYASRDIGPWRPTLAGRSRMQQYQDADLRFLRTAFIPGE